MIRFTTVAKEASAEQTIDKSRFIAHVKPVYSKEEADAFIKEIKQQYKDATHNVPAFVIGEKQELLWASDDGEPSGTSGPPMLQMLVREGLTNIVMVVTRYFGGIKLGTGGLVRAYTSSAKLALEAAGIHTVQDVRIIEMVIPYNLLGKIQNKEKDYPFEIQDIQYLDKIILKICLHPEDYDAIINLFFELTQGGLEVLSETDAIV